MLLSAVGVGFGVLADETDAVVQYTVNADTSPAIPMFAGTKVNLDNVDVLFAGETEATDGALITWTLADGYSSKEIGQNGNEISAFAKGTYKITATYGGHF